MYVITGATGHTGNIVARRLLSEGKEVRAVGRHQERLQSLVEAGAKPFVCDLADPVGLGKAFAGAEAVYIMIPPETTTANFRAFQDRITDSVVSALTAARVKYAVLLSSVGADKSSKTGPVVGLYNLEKRLGTISGLNVLSLRAGYFMENTLSQAMAIHAMEKAAGPVRPDLKLPLIASRDIGQVAAEALLRLDFRGQQTRELLGQRDLNYIEIAEIIGQAIAKPDLKYVQLSDTEFRGFTAKVGMSADFANLILEMVAAMNSGHMRAQETRSARNTTPTSFETFVEEEFVPVYEAPMAARA